MKKSEKNWRLVALAGVAATVGLQPAQASEGMLLGLNFVCNADQFVTRAVEVCSQQDVNRAQQFAVGYANWKRLNGSNAAAARVACLSDASVPDAKQVLDRLNEELVGQFVAPVYKGDYKNCDSLMKRLDRTSADSLLISALNDLKQSKSGKNQ